MPKTKYTPPFVTVTMPDGNEVRIKRFSALAQPGLADFKKLYQRMVEIFVEQNASFGEMLLDPEAVKLIQDMAAIVPILGSDEIGIDVNQLLEEGDNEQICSLFVAAMERSGPNMGDFRKDENGSFIPGEIAKLNQLDFFKYFLEGINKNREKEALLKEAVEKIESSELSPVPEVQK